MTQSNPVTLNVCIKWSKSSKTHIKSKIYKEQKKLDIKKIK